MAIELCLESYGALAGSIDTGFMRSLIDIRPTVRRWTSVSPRDNQTQAKHEEQILVVADELPFEQAEALWLVDVCGYSYDTAATSTSSSHKEVGERIADARRTIRQELI